MSLRTRALFRGSAAVIAALLSATPLAAEFTLISSPKLGLASPVGALSPDGSMLVGTDVIDGNTTAIYWTEAEGVVALPHASSVEPHSFARDLSADGSVIVGGGRNDDNADEAVRWDRQSDGSYTVTLLTPPANGTGAFIGPTDFFGTILSSSVNMEATAVSGDGSVIVGYGDSTDFDGPPTQAWAWTSEDGFIPLGYLSDGEIAEKANLPRVFSRAEDIDREASAIVGQSWPGLNSNGTAAMEAFLYDTDSGQMTGLGDLITPVFGSVAYGVSPDGTVTVGQARDGAPSLQVAFRQTASEGMQSLGDLPGGSTTARALAASNHGSVIVGEATTERGTEAFVWTAGLGMARLETVAGLTLAELGAGYLESAVAVSDDGRTIAGSYIIRDTDPKGGDNLRQAYVLRLSREQLALGPDLEALAAATAPELLPAAGSDFTLRFARDPDAGVTYLLQGSEALGPGFDDLIRYQADGLGNFQRQVLDPAFGSDPTGSTPGQAVERFPAPGGRYFLRIALEP